MPKSKNEDVMEMVRKQLEKQPDTDTGTLFEKAKEIDSSLEDLTLRQFHARYPLQVKRKMSAQKKGRKGRAKRGDGAKKRGKQAPSTATGGDAAREAVRQGLLGFARDVAAADGKAGLIPVLTRVEDYVDQVMDGMEKAGS